MLDACRAKGDEAAELFPGFQKQINDQLQFSG